MKAPHIFLIFMNVYEKNKNLLLHLRVKHKPDGRDFSHFLNLIINHRITGLYFIFID